MALIAVHLNAGVILVVTLTLVTVQHQEYSLVLPTLPGILVPTIPLQKQHHIKQVYSSQSFLLSLLFVRHMHAQNSSTYTAHPMFFTLSHTSAPPSGTIHAFSHFSPHIWNKSHFLTLQPPHLEQFTFSHTSALTSGAISAMPKSARHQPLINNICFMLL